MGSNTPSIQLDTRVLDKLNREAPGKAKRIVKKIGFDVQAYAVQHMSTSSPSAPGEPPGVDTGLLKNSIHVEEVGEMALAWLTLLLVLGVGGTVFLRLVDAGGVSAEVTSAEYHGADTIVTGNWSSDLTLLVKAAQDAGLDAKFYTYYASVSGDGGAVIWPLLVSTLGLKSPAFRASSAACLSFSVMPGMIGRYGTDWVD